jgi:trehalose-phosphatase
VLGLLAALEARADTRVAVISGRPLDDVAARVGVPEIVYAGNHGLEIRGHDFHLVHESALSARSELDNAAAALQSVVDGFPGAWVEHKGLTLAVHFRKVRAPAEQGLRERVAASLEGLSGLRVAEGKKIFEILPAIQWDKGCALEWICSDSGRCSGAVPGRRPHRRNRISRCCAAPRRNHRRGSAANGHICCSLSAFDDGGQRLPDILSGIKAGNGYNGILRVKEMSG